MRLFLILSQLLSFALLCSCGNANDGKSFNPYRKSGGASQANLENPVLSSVPVPQPLICKNPTLSSGGSPAFDAIFAGSVFCPMQGISPGTKGFMARLKVNAALPSDTRLCAIPFVYDSPANETCFSLNGQADFSLSTDQYTSVVILAESNLGAYKAFLMNAGVLPPPRVIYTP